MRIFKVIFILLLATASFMQAAQLADSVSYLSSLKPGRAELAAAVIASSVAAKESYAPTRAYLDQPELKRLVQKKYSEFIGEHRPLVQNILENEQRHITAGYIPLYHAQMSLLSIISDFLRISYAAKTGNELRADFEFLRHPSVACPAADVNQWITSLPKKLTKCSDFDDGNEQIYKILLPVNFSLWGNNTFKFESTFEFFADNVSQAVNDEVGLADIFTEIFASEGLNQLYIKDLIALAQEFATKTGVIYQIFVPEDQVDKIVYLSRPWGVPSNELRDVNDHVIASNDYDQKDKRYINCSGVLKQYCQNAKNLMSIEPETGRRYALDMIQGRLLLQSYVLSPDSGVKIVKYSTMSSQNRRVYTTKLAQLCSIIFAKPVQALQQQREYHDADDEKTNYAWINNGLHDLTLTDRIIQALKANDAVTIARIMQTEIKENNVQLDDEGNTVFHYAVREGRPGIVVWLTMFGEDPNCENIWHRTPFYMAACCECVENGAAMIRCLKACGAQIQQSVEEPSLLALAIGHYESLIKENRQAEAFEIITTLLDCGAELERPRDLSLPIRYASQSGHADVIRLLLERGANVNARDRTGMTALHVAKNSQVAQLLIDNKADVNSKTDWGVTPLAYAAERKGKSDVVELLLRNKADHTINSRFGFSILHSAAHSGDLQTVALLLQYRADPNARSRDGGTPADLTSDEQKKALLLAAMQTPKSV